MSMDKVGAITGDGFASLLGAELVESAVDRVAVKLPYKEALGIGRIHGGAISALVDIAATAAFWSHPDTNATSRGATVSFSINYLKLAVATDLTAIATVRRRGGSICVGDVSVENADGEELAVARVTYKLET